MNSIKIFALLFVAGILLNSCSRKEGDWDDNIELSQKNVSFNAALDSITITTTGESWWLSDIRLDDEHINFESVNTIESSFDIIESEFAISRKNTKELQINMSENVSMEARELIIGVQSGNYFDNIRVIQEGM